MPDNDGGDRFQGAAWTYFKPRGGFSKGARQGLLVCAVLLLLLFLSIYVLGAPPGTPKAMFADTLLGLLLAVAGVWVVGGVVELDTTRYDLGIKAGGGIAILLLVTLYIQPISSASGQVKYAESITLSPWDTVGTILSHYKEQSAQMQADAIRIVIPQEIEDEVLNFRATTPPDVSSEYKTNWGFPRRNPKLRVLDEITERQDCLSFAEQNGKFVAVLNGEKLEKKTRPAREEKTVYMCKRE